MDWPNQLERFSTLRWQPWLLVAAVGVALWACASWLSIVKPPVGPDGVETYTDISSFMGTMIPLNLVGSLGVFKEWAFGFISHRRDVFVTRCAIKTGGDFVEAFAGLVEEADSRYSKMREKNDRDFLIWMKRFGFMVAVLTTLSFVTGVFAEWKPYVVLIAWPVLAYVVLTIANGCLWNKTFAYLWEHMEASPVDPSEFEPCDDQTDIFHIKGKIK